MAAQQTVLEDKIQNPSKFLFRFSADAMLWIKEVDLVDSVDELKIFAVNCREGFPEFELLDARTGSALNKIHPEFPLQEIGQSGGTEKLSKRIGFFEEDRSLT